MNNRESQLIYESMYERPQFEIASDGAHEVTSSGEEARIYVDVVNQPDLEDYIPIDVEVEWYGEHEDASWGYYGGDPGDSPMIDLSLIHISEPTRPY